MTGQHNVEAVIKNSPIHFKISQEFARNCINSIGSVVNHAILGPIFCDEAIIDDNGLVNMMIFIGTSNKNGLY